MITTEQIKALRDSTGVSVMQCKKALEEANGDPQKALDILKKKSREIAEKKSDRELGAGAIAAYIHAGGSVGAMIELSCETDFVAKNEDFKALAYDIAMHAAAANPEFVSKEDITDEVKQRAEELFEKEVAGENKPEDIKKKIMEGKLDAYFKERILLEQPFIKDPDVAIKQLVEEGTQKFGERIKITRFARFAV